MYQALYRKYRPSNFEDVVGQDIIIKTLTNSIANNKVSHAYLFTGPRGTGKTSIAKAFAKLINCEHPLKNKACNNCVSCTKTIQKQNTDIIEIDAASNNGVDEIREIRSKVALVPSYSKYKVYIIDEVHMLSTGAFNALLKTLEEPPSHVIFILATTEPHKIPSTILSRCQRFDFKRIPIVDIVNKLNTICEQEQVKITHQALYEMAILSDGGMRDSISLLDQTISYVDLGAEITVEDVYAVSGTVNDKNMVEFLNSLFNKDMGNVLQSLDNFDKGGININKFTEQLVMFLKNIILFKTTPNYLKKTKSDVSAYEKLSNIENNIIMICIDILNDSISKMATTNNTRLLLELALIQMINYNDKTNNILEQQMFEEIKEKTTIPTPIEKPLKLIENVKASKIRKQNEDLIEYKIENSDLYIEFKNQRINNTLSRFDKKQIIDINKKMDTLLLDISNPIYGKYVGMFVDAKIKATSNEDIIFVFDEKSVSETFNEQIPLLEKLLTKVAINQKIISTYLEDWNEIKTEFNGKQKQYIYDLALINEEEVYEPASSDKNDIQNLFDECIEYK